MEPVYQVTVTAPTKDEAQVLAHHVVGERLAACAQVVGPIESTYWWEGKVESATEWLVLLKTAAARLDRLVEVIERRHSYSVPEVLAVPVAGGNTHYLAWVVAETSPGAV